jgi:Ubiquitin carboxyl-terminal hydrolase
MCLKRYSLVEGGKTIRLGTQIDIPTEIGLPHFISDDSMDEDGPIYGNFKLSLQSVVCHQGNSVDSGHYISLVKGTKLSLEVEHGSTTHTAQDTNHWMRFDDLASERITLVDITQALKDETPYLLFYQIVPIDNDPGSITDGESLPLYAPSEAFDPGVGRISSASLGLPGSSDGMPALSRPSMEITAPDGSPRGRSPLREQGEQSVSSSEPPNQGELKVPDAEPSQPSSRRGSTHGKGGPHSRSQSQTGERFTISLSKMTRRKSKEAVPTLGSTVVASTTNDEGAEASVAEDEKGKGFLRREVKREKSKMRLGKAAGKGKGEKPDRECSVM